MKKLIAVFLTIALVLPLCMRGGESTAYADKAPIWEKVYYTDVFGDPTDEWYITNAEMFSGTFNNSATNNSPMRSKILVDLRNASIILYEYDSNQLKNAFSNDIIFHIAVKAASGEQFSTIGTLAAKSDRIVIATEDTNSFIWAMYGAGTASFYLEQADQPLNNYLFKAECGNFEALFKEELYQLGLEYLRDKNYEDAATIFIYIDGYKDSNEQLGKTIEGHYTQEYAAAEKLLEKKDPAHAAMAFYAVGDYSDSRERSFSLWEQVTQRDTIATGWLHTVGLKTDGTVIATGYKEYGACDVAGWKDIVAIAAEGYHTLGLKSDGTVLAAGDNENGQCNVTDWKDIVAVAAGDSHSVGLKADGTVVAAGSNEYGQCNVASWDDIIAIDAGGTHTVGLKADGTVVAVGNKANGRCRVSKWNDVVSIIAGGSRTMGLKADGGIVVVGDNEKGQCNVTDWKEVTALAAAAWHSLGLKVDGTVSATSNNGGDVSGWTDIVAVSASNAQSVGLKADGTVVAEGWNKYGQCDVSDWTGIKIPTSRSVSFSNTSGESDTDDFMEEYKLLTERLKELASRSDEEDYTAMGNILDDTISLAERIAASPDRVLLDMAAAKADGKTIEEEIVLLHEWQDRIEACCYTDCYVMRLENIVDFPLDYISSDQNSFMYGYTSSAYLQNDFSTYKAYLDKYFSLISQEDSTYLYDVGDGNTLEVYLFDTDTDLTELAGLNLHTIYITPPVMAEADKNWGN